MAKLTKEQARALLAGATPEEIMRDLQEEKQALAKEEADKVLPGLLPKVAARDYVALKAALRDGTNEGNIETLYIEARAALEADQFDEFMVICLRIFKSLRKSLPHLEPPPPPSPLP
jgi:hypothetical protein